MRGAEPANEAQMAALALSNESIAELKSADTIIVGAPMYNFGIPSTLTAWFDYVLRARVTFRYTEAGPEGLLDGIPTSDMMTSTIGASRLSLHCNIVAAALV
jgi:FMN-dependent NADH-azoreductase